MKTLSLAQRPRAFTLLELLLLLLIVFVLAALLLPAHSGRGPAPRVRCMSNLKQVGVGLVLWASDHGDQFPAQVPLTNGGSLELIGVGSHNAVPLSIPMGAEQDGFSEERVTGDLITLLTKKTPSGRPMSIFLVSFTDLNGLFTNLDPFLLHRLSSLPHTPPKLSRKRCICSIKLRCIELLL